MSSHRLSDYVHVRAMRLIVFALLASIALVLPFSGLAAPQQTQLAHDTFSRTNGAAWGRADSGDRYRMSGHGSALSVARGKGRITLRRDGAVANVSLARVSVRDAAIRFRFGVPQRADGGGVSVAAILRGSSSGNQYRVRVRIASDRSVWLAVIRVRPAGGGRQLGREVRVRGLRLAPGGSLAVRARINGATPVRLRARVWQGGGSEPSTWQIKRQDWGGAITAPGAIGLRVALADHGTAAPVRVAIDNLTVLRLRNVQRRRTATRPEATSRPRPTRTPRPPVSDTNESGPKTRRLHQRCHDRHRDGDLVPQRAGHWSGRIRPDEIVRQPHEARDVV